MTTATKEVDVFDYAQSALDKAAGDPYRAAEILETMAQDTPPLKDELLDPLLASACYDAIRRICIARRGYVAKQADTVLSAKSAAGAKRIKSHASQLMNFLLPHGAVKLADAKRQDVERAVDFYRAQARTELQRAAFLDLVAAKLDSKKRVSDVLKEDDLLTFWERSKK